MGKKIARGNRDKILFIFFPLEKNLDNEKCIKTKNKVETKTVGKIT